MDEYKIAILFSLSRKDIKLTNIKIRDKKGSQTTRTKLNSFQVEKGISIPRHKEKVTMKQIYFLYSTSSDHIAQR